MTDLSEIYISSDGNDLKIYIPFMEKYKQAYGKIPKKTPAYAGYGSYGVLNYKSGKRGITQICNDLGLNTSGYALHKWVNIYGTNGEFGFLTKVRNKSYSKEFKDTVVYAYLDGKGSYDELAIKYNIPSSSTLKNWVKKYNSHIALKKFNPQGDVYMTKARKTTIKKGCI